MKPEEQEAYLEQQLEHCLKLWLVPPTGLQKKDELTEALQPGDRGDMASDLAVIARSFIPTGYWLDRVRTLEQKVADYEKMLGYQASADV